MAIRLQFDFGLDIRRIVPNLFSAEGRKSRAGNRLRAKRKVCRDRHGKAEGENGREALRRKIENNLLQEGKGAGGCADS